MSDRKPRRNLIFRALLIPVFLLSMCSPREYSKEDFIRIELFGPSDEQIKVIVISISEIPKKVDWERNYIVSQKHFSVIEEFISKYTEDIPTVDKKTQDWIVFRITTTISGTIQKNVLPSKETSVDFFSRLSDFLSMHSDDKAVLELKTQVDVTLKQISW